MGEFTRSIASFNEAISLYDVKKHQVLIRITGADPGIFSMAQSSHVLWYLGYPDQALERAKQALSEANRLEIPYSQSMSGFLNTLVYLLIGDTTNVEKEARACIELSDKYGMQLFSSEVKNFLGWALVEQGETDKGIKLIKQSLAWRKKRKMYSGTNIHLTLLINIYLKSNKIKEGLKSVEEGLDVSNRFGDQLFLSEIYRLKGELLFAQDEIKNRKLTEECLDRALELAQDQNAKSLELRASISKARFLQKQKKVDEAQEILAENYNWFTEGFETKDLKEAKVLLEELSTKVVSST